MRSDPPKLAERILRWLVPGRDGDVILGDLRETWDERGGGRAWYWLQVLTCLRLRLSPYRRVIPDVRQDVHYAMRMIRRNPGYAALAMVCLALGVGVNATVFSLVDGMYFQLLPVPRADRVAAIDRDGRMPLYWRDYRTLDGSLTAFQSLAAISTRGTFMDVERSSFAITVEAVTASYIDLLQQKPLVGRWWTAADDQPGAEPVAVVSVALWRRQFDGDGAVVGRHVRIENRWYRIVGVASPGFAGVSRPAEVDAWVPLVTFPLVEEQLRDPRGTGPMVSMIGRLADGATTAGATAELAVADARLRTAYPDLKRYQTPIAAHVFRGLASPDSRLALQPLAALLAGVVGVVLLIACANVANLLLLRATVREREMSIRRSLGASRGRLVRQDLAESLVLAVGGTALGIVAGWWADRALCWWLPASIPNSIPHGLALEINWRVALATAAVALLSTTLFSLMPALAAARPDRRVTTRQRNFYVVAQVALSLVLLVSGGLLLRALDRASRIDPGFSTDHRIYIRLFTPETDFTPDASLRLFTRLLEEARALPEVRDATLSLGLLGFNDGDCVATQRDNATVHAQVNVVEPNYFRMMDVPLLRGRNFAPADEPTTLRAVIVNETMARQMWPNEDPVGKTLWQGCGERKPRVQAQVIGVARDLKYESLDEQPQPFFYLSRQQVWWNGFFALVVQTGGDPNQLREPLIRLARSAGESVRSYEVRTFEEVTERSLWRIRWQATLLGAFSGLAMVLAVIGLYGVVAYAVAQRTREIGVRMALGAQPGDVHWLVLGQGLRLTGLGIAVGLVLGAGVTRFLRAFLYGLDPLDPWAFCGAALAWTLIAMLACYVPARRAARVDPAVSLRYE